MRDPLCVRLREAHADLGREAVALHRPQPTIAAWSRRERLAELSASGNRASCSPARASRTESGIPDFRSPSGIWAEFDPFEVATIEAFRRDPARVWDFYARRFRPLLDAEPNAAHLALAELERRGLLAAVVTQNIDLLHERAGSRDVVEVHGSIRSAVCPACGARGTARRRAGDVEAAPCRPAPRCGAVLKPGVVLFGELLPVAAIERATELARTAGPRARRRLVARGMARRGPSARARPASSRSSTAARRRSTTAQRSSSTRARARRSPRSSRHSATRLRRAAACARRGRDGTRRRPCARSRTAPRPLAERVLHDASVPVDVCSEQTFCHCSITVGVGSGGGTLNCEQVVCIVRRRGEDACLRGRDRRRVARRVRRERVFDVARPEPSAAARAAGRAARASRRTPTRRRGWPALPP